MVKIRTTITLHILMRATILTKSYCRDISIEYYGDKQDGKHKYLEFHKSFLCLAKFSLVKVLNFAKTFCLVCAVFVCL